MPERLFRYVDPWRVHAYAALGWNAIGECPSPHDGRRKFIMEWVNVGEPVEPPERTVVQILAEEFVGGIVLEGDVVTRAAPIVAYMAKQRWTRNRVQDYCRRRAWSFQIIADNDAQAGPRGHRVEASELAVPVRPLVALAQGEESEEPGGTPRGA